MHKLLPSLSLLFFAVARLAAQGICDSVISIAPIQPLCAGTGEAYLSVSHPGGVFSGSGLIYGTSYLNTEYLGAGIYTAKYTITGPSGCTVQATRQFEVLDAEYAFPWVSGDIDCSNPNSTVMLQAFLMNSNNFWGGSWYGPSGSNISGFGNTVTTDYAGKYFFEAHPVNSNDCPAYASVDVAFVNNAANIKIVDCTDCSDWPQKIRIESVPPNWQTSVSTPNGYSYYSPSDSTGCFAAILGTGVWKVEAKNPDNGCKSTDTQYLDTDYPTPSVSAGSNISIWCGGAGQFLAAMLPQSGSLFNYFWTTPNGSTAPATYAGLLPATDPGIYVLHGVNTFTGCEDRDTAFAGVAPTPVSTQISVICDGESLNGHTQSGNYVDTLTLANGCPKIQFTKLIVLAPLLDSPIILPDNGQMTGSIEITVTQGWPPFSYYWDNGAVTSSISNLAAATYTVSITDANGCEHVREYEVPSNKPNRKGASFRESSILLQARVFPNPTPEGLATFTVDVNSSQSTEATLLLHDVLGRVISTQTVQIMEGKNSFPIAEKLSEGLYTILLQGDFGLKQVSKLVVTKP